MASRSSGLLAALLVENGIIQRLALLELLRERHVVLHTKLWVGKERSAAEM